MKPFFAQLPNGLQIIAQALPEAKSLALSLTVRSGARHDQQLGAAHFLEHMLFKGSEQFSALELSQGFDVLGAHANAFTSHELTTYTASALPSTQSRLTELLLGMMQPRLDSEDVAIEKNVILEEIELYKDDPMSLALESSAEHYFGGHPLGRPVIGTKTSVAQMQPSHLQSHLARHYSTDQMILAACGVFDWQRLLEDAERFSSVLPKQVLSEPIYPAFVPRSGLILKKHDTTHHHISLIASGYPANHPLELAAAIAARIIGDSENSRLSWALVHQGLALSASLEHEGHTDLGAFYGGIECSPEQSQACLEVLQAELSRAREQGITAQELSRMKRKLEVGLAMRLETPSAWIGAFVEDFALQNDLREPKEVLEQLRLVRLEEVNAALFGSGLAQPLVVVLGQ